MGEGRQGTRDQVGGGKGHRGRQLWPGLSLLMTVFLLPGEIRLVSEMV